MFGFRVSGWANLCPQHVHGYEFSLHFIKKKKTKCKIGEIIQIIISLWNIQRKIEDETEVTRITIDFI